MTILVIAIGSYGDVLPLVRLALELQTRGHHVTFFTNDHFADLVQRAGLDFIALGTAAEYDSLANHPNLWHPRKGWKVIGSASVSDGLGRTYSILRERIVPGKTVMVSTTLGFAARLLQETDNIPTATVHLSPGVFHSAYQPPKMPGLPLPEWLPVSFKRMMWTLLNHAFIDPVVKPRLNRFRQDLGLPPVSHIFHHWLHSPDLVLCLFPEWFAAPQPDWPAQTRMTGFPLFDDAHEPTLPSGVQKFLDQGPPPLAFTPGSVNKQGQQFFEEAVKACQLLGRRGILLSLYSEQLPPSLPDGIQHFPYVPLSQLLPQCAALVHHGGIGTCAQALKAGLPQLIQPLAFDQFDNAARVRRLGVGTMLPNRSFHATLIAKQLQDLLTSPARKAHCQTVSSYFTNIAPITESCELIESTLTC